MAQQKTTYTLADILGAPISEQEALNFIRQNTDEDSFRTYNLMDNAYREKLLHFIMGETGLSHRFYGKKSRSLPSFQSLYSQQTFFF